MRKLSTSDGASFFRACSPSCYPTLVSSAFFDLSNKRCSEKSMFTCWSVLTDFCHHLHLPLIEPFVLMGFQLKCFQRFIVFAYTNVVIEFVQKFCMKEIRKRKREGIYRVRL